MDSSGVYFFYGTLVDRDLLARVAGQPIDELEIEPAIIAGFRRTGVIRQRYPILLRDASSHADGILVSGLSRRARSRLADYEGANYRLERVTVAGGSGRPVDAMVFQFIGRLRSNHRHWRLDSWQRRWKRRAMRRAGRLKDSPARA
jgi:hypothetical protein